jgi:AbrB family looped-hinge helix DNA binding protein
MLRTILIALQQPHWSVAMRQITCTLTSRGRVTIPKQIRVQLGIDANDRVTFVVDDAGRVELRPTKYQWKDLRGVVSPILGARESVDFREAFEDGMQQRADDLISGRQG